MRVTTLLGAAAMLAANAMSEAVGAQAPEASGHGFLFGTPRLSASLRFGYASATGGSDLFAFVTDELSLHQRDFSSFSAAGDFSVALNRRIDLVLSMDSDGMKKQSDYREWEDNSGNPIEQETEFDRQSYLLSVKYYLRPNGRTLGRLAWIPTRYVPWVSVGGGRTHYRFSQNGDFVDFEKDNKVFHDSFRSSQWGMSGQVSAGVDLSLSERFALTTQARYLLGKADLDSDFSGFEPIDLSGLGLTAGLTIRF